MACWKGPTKFPRPPRRRPITDQATWDTWDMLQWFVTSVFDPFAKCTDKSVTSFGLEIPVQFRMIDDPLDLAEILTARTSLLQPQGGSLVASPACHVTGSWSLDAGAKLEVGITNPLTTTINVVLRAYIQSLTDRTKREVCAATTTAVAAGLSNWPIAFGAPLAGSPVLLDLTIPAEPVIINSDLYGVTVDVAWA